MASIMSSQYPPLPIYGTELNSPHSEYILPYSVPPQQSSLDTSSAQNNLPYDSAGSLTKGNIPATSVMHPQPQLNDAQTSGEKKRNKLGYHRTSLACGHCRRRKIRCIPSPSDSQGRCINCIRLKKDCSFHPVDQQGQPEPRGKQSSQSSTGSKVGSATSSPASSHANPVEKPENQMFGSSTNHPVPAVGKSGRKSSIVSTLAPKVKGSLKVSVNQPYGIGDDSNGGEWFLTNASQDPDFGAEEANVASKAYIPESPMGSQYPSLAYGAPPSSAGWATSTSEMAPQTDFTWEDFSPPVRSMSYGGEPLGSRQPIQTTLPIHHSRQYIRRPSTLAELYPSSLDVSIPDLSSGAGAISNNAVPLSAGAIPPASFGAWNQHTQLQPHIHPPRAMEDDQVAWRYTETGAFPQSHTNEYISPPDADPSLYYVRQ